MKKCLFVLAFLLACTAVGAEGPKLKALLVTGGGYHDYQTLNPILTEKIGALAPVAFDVKYGLDTLNDPKFAQGYDVVVYNFCFDNPTAKGQVEHALQTTKDGKPTVLIHCAMHTFRGSEAWTDLCGMRTRRHDPFAAFVVVKADKRHPILKQLPDEWNTPGDEMYQTIKLGERSKVLLRARNDKLKSEHVVCWVSTYGKGNVFATTLGHDLKTAKMPEYHRLLANGLLWACGKLEKPANGRR